MPGTGSRLLDMIFGFWFVTDKVVALIIIITTTIIIIIIMVVSNLRR